MFQLRFLVFLFGLFLVNGQNINTNVFKLILTEKDLNPSSTNLIKSVETKKKQCIFTCNQISYCGFVIFNSNGTCKLCKFRALNELINGQDTNLYLKQK